MRQRARYSQGFDNAVNEVDQCTLPYIGKLPKWLSGELIRIAPALFDLECGDLKHWLDGFGYLYKFDISDKEITFQSKFLKSKAYLEARKATKPTRAEYASRPTGSLLYKMRTLLTPPAASDNANANIISLGDNLAAVSDYSFPLGFDPEKLETLSPFQFEDELKGDRMISHPQYDEQGNTFGLLLTYGRPASYVIYRQDTGSRRRLEIAHIKTARGSFVHSMGMSDHYFIITACPFFAPSSSPSRSGRSYIESYRWKPGRGTNLSIISRDSGEEVARPNTEPFFSFHHVNAFEEGKYLMVDQIVYPDASVIKAYYLKSLRSTGHSVVTGHLMRLVINMETGKVEDELMLSETCFELPRINPDFHRRAYKYCYGTADTSPGEFFDSLVKIDVSNGNSTFWKERDCYPGEPIFVPKPESRHEDEGVLLSVVLDASTECSFLLILDAMTLEEQARVETPVCIPFGMHGNFYG